MSIILSLNWLTLIFKVNRDTPFFRATAAKQLHQALNEKKAGNAQMKYLITLPDPCQHRNDITGKVMQIVNEHVTSTFR